MKTDGSDVHQVASPSSCTGSSCPTTLGTDEARAPNSDLIAFAANSSATPPTTGFDTDGIYTMNPDGSQITDVTAALSAECADFTGEGPSWSPDGTQIAFAFQATLDTTNDPNCPLNVATDPFASPDELSGIAITNPDGSSYEVIVRGASSNPVWQP
jgi:Tol biopolymer transport system component